MAKKPTKPAAPVAATYICTCDRLPRESGHVHVRDEVITDLTAIEAKNYEAAGRVARV